MGLPAASGWTPVLAEGTQVPARGVGFEVGAHARLARLRALTLSAGATLLTGRGSVESERSASGPSVSLSRTVSTRLIAVAPQLSLNFGHRLGWSYVSGGLGRARVRSETSVPAGPGVASEVQGQWSGARNVGGGARWFLSDRLGVAFDLRWHQLAAVSRTLVRPAAPRATVFTAGVGVSFQ